MIQVVVQIRVELSVPSCGNTQRLADGRGFKFTAENVAAYLNTPSL